MLNMLLLMRVVYGLISDFMSKNHCDFFKETKKHALSSTQISHKPETIDDIEAAGVLYAGLTAWSGLYISGHIGGVLGALTSQGKLHRRM